MRVLVVGGGGREHALCWALRRSPLLTELICAPGNPGIADIAECVALAADDVAGLVALARARAVDLVVVGPEAPLVAGIADACAAAGIACFGPSAAAARLEGSKAFMKEIADAAGIPTARWARFDDAAAARAHLAEFGAPIVVKADGLAAGKGVVVAATVAEAEAAIADFLEAGTLGEAGATVILEECLTGPELSFFAICDGNTALPLPAAADHKRVGEGDTGPNTGGMGAYAPAPLLTPALQGAVMGRIIRPALEEMARRGMPFRGVLFAGLMLTQDGPKLLEFNVRFGDPECQALLPLLESDLLPVLHAAATGTLGGTVLRWADRHALVVVLAARGYPAAPVRGGRIADLDRAAAIDGVRVFQAGTARREDGALVAAGGRVLGVLGTGTTPQAARAAAYAGVDAIDFADGFCRRDIGVR